MTISLARGFSLVALLALGMTGCTSVLTSASLRDLVWDNEEHAAEAAATAADETDGPADLPTPGNGDEDAGPARDATAAAEAQRREAAIEEASARLAKLGHLDAAARAALVETLERTDQEDWPAVIAAFAESLADTEETPAAGDLVEGALEATDPHVVAKADLDAAGPVEAAPEPMAAAEAVGDAGAQAPLPPQVEAAPLVATDVAPEPDQSPAADGARAAEQPKPGVPESAPGPQLAVQNACFASRVQAWGVVDRFAADRFHPGQEVIVYFELAGTTAGDSPAGHTTCIDTALRLVAADGRELHAWSFEPIAETCRARRHDYFARYVVRLPEHVADGPCRVELDVTDTLSGQVAKATLPLEIRPAASAE
ncbi:MAG: hypothetical protein ACKOCX_02475 [Planctomycetota bacterium]